jgi:hypothetical protein
MERRWAQIDAFMLPVNNASLTPGNSMLAWLELMSARKINSVGALGEQVMVEARRSSLTLSPEAVSIHRGGIEFRCEKSFSRWVEMTVSIQSPHDGAQVNCTGVVVDCTGNKHVGYHVSMVFTSLSKQAESRLNTIMYSRAI